MYTPICETKPLEEIEKLANSLVYNVIRRVLEGSRCRSASGICSPSSPSLLCSLSEDSVVGKSVPPTQNSPEDGKGYSLGVCMEDVMSKLLDSKSDTLHPNKPTNKGGLNESQLIVEASYPINCRSRANVDLMRDEDEGDFDEEDDEEGVEIFTSLMPASHRPIIKREPNVSQQIFSLRKAYSESTLLLVKDRDILVREVPDEYTQANVRALGADLDRLFGESEIIISKCVGHFWDFVQKSEEELVAASSDTLPLTMSERLCSVEDFTFALRNEFKDYNDMIKRIVFSTYKLAKESCSNELQSLQRKIQKKDIILNHFREENMRITHAMMEKEQDWALLKSKLYTEILNLTKETAKPWKELLTTGPKFGLVSLPLKRLKSLFEIYHNQEKMMSLVLDRDRKINELKLLIYQQQNMNCNLQEKLLLLSSTPQEHTHPQNIQPTIEQTTTNEMIEL